MNQTERNRYFFFLSMRSFVAIFDLIGILAVGFLATSIALFITQGSDPGRIITFSGISIPAANAQTLPIIAIVILVLFSLKAVLSILLTRQLAYFLARIEARAARAVAGKAFGSGIEQARKQSREEIYFAVQVGSPSAFNSTLNALGTIVAEAVLFVMVIGSFLIIDPLSAMGTLLYFTLVAGIIQFFVGNMMHKASTVATAGIIEANTALGDLSEVLREATVLGKQSFFLERIYAARTKAASATASQVTWNSFPRYIVETALILAVAGFILWQSHNGDLVNAAGVVGIFLSGGLRLTASLLPLQSALLSIKQSVPLAEKALQFLKPAKEPEGMSHLLENPPIHGFKPVGVEFSRVSYSYTGSSEPALRNVSMSIQPGQQVALIGPSGAGKSTIADLILGVLEPKSGEVLVDGQDPSQIIGKHPGRLCYVPQRPGIISGTVLDNIALGLSRAEVDMLRLQKVVAYSHLTEVIEDLPLGLDTNLGKRLDELSGGQLQRIGLARALYSNPGLLVMDEATSALDAVSADEVITALDGMREKTTVILVAHRLETVQRCDVVFLVESGRITASGTFPDLLRSNETVRILANLMSLGANDT
jgi:ATP-binding cassette subfamily C protein